MESKKLREISGPFIIWLFFTVYYVVIAISVWSRSSVGGGGGGLPTAISLPIVLSLLLNLALNYGVLLAFLLGFVAFWEKRRSLRHVFSSLGLKAQGSAKSVVWSIALFPFYAIVGLVGLSLGFFSASATAPALNSTQTPLWILWYMVIYAFFPVAVVEELFARGYLLDRLMPKHPSRLREALPAMLLSSFLFTLWHIPGYWAQGFPSLRMIGLLAGNVFPLSLILSVAYVRAGTRNIAGPILVHFLLDGIPVLIAIIQYA